MRPHRLLQRRSFLKAAGGVCVALPFLESLVPKPLRAQAAVNKRFAVFFTCNGVNMERFFPTGGFGAISEANLTGTALEPLTSHVNSLLVPRGTYQVPIGFGREGNGDDHMKGMGCKLTAQNLSSSSDAYAQGVSVDQVIARELNPTNPNPLTLFVGRRGSGVMAHISYRGANEPVTGENNPWLAYRDFMGMGADASPPATDAASRIVERQQSVLDVVRQEFESLNAVDLGQADRAKLDQHFTTIRELEVAMTTPSVGALGCSLAQATEQELMAIDARAVNDEVNYKQMGDLSIEVLALALACNHTNVATIQWGNGAGGPIFKWDGLDHEVNHHKLSHGSFHDDCFPGDEREKCQNQPANWQDHLHAIDRWHATRFAKLLDRLQSYTEGDGTVLDNSVIVWANELSDGRDHHFANLPWIIAGSGSGYLKQGQHIDLTNGGDLYDFSRIGISHNRLLVTFLNAMGIEREEFGDPEFARGQGIISELVA